jgi:hypothetical protein
MVNPPGQQNMTRRSAPLSLIALTALAAAAAATLLGAQEPPKSGFADAVLGRWDLTVQGADAPYPSWVNVHLRKESELQGEFVGRSGSVRHITSITYEEGRLVFEIPIQYEKNKSPLRFEGRLSGDTLEGTTVDADGRTLKWTGVRAPEFGPMKDVTWGAPIELFNGRDVSGWKPRTTARPGCWRVSEGVLVANPPCVDLISERTFRDVKLHVEYMYPKGANSGLYLRGRYEVQINDDAGKVADPLRSGGVYGFIRPYVNAARPPDEWQSVDVTLIGQRVSITLNGTVIAEHERIPGITGGALDSNEASPGPLLLQGDHGKISFRKITLAEPR